MEPLAFYTAFVLAVGTPLGLLLSLTARKPLPLRNYAKVPFNYQPGEPVIVKKTA